MAQIQTKNGIRMDMTPMVDLAFLLLTFFILTSVFNHPSAITLRMPMDIGTPTEMNGATIIVDSTNQYFAVGDFLKHPNRIHKVNHLENELLQTKNAFQKASKPLFVVVLVADNTPYQKVIHVLDDLSIADIKSYSLQDKSAAEIQALLPK